MLPWSPDFPPACYHASSHPAFWLGAIDGRSDLNVKRVMERTQDRLGFLVSHAIQPAWPEVTLKGDYDISCPRVISSCDFDPITISRKRALQVRDSLSCSTRLEDASTAGSSLDPNAYPLLRQPLPRKQLTRIFLATRRNVGMRDDIARWNAMP